MKILLAGDWHGNVQHMRNVFARACRVEADIIVQLGDFGFGWDRKQFKGGNGLVECAFVRQCEKMVEETGIPVYWLPGNHENYDMLDYSIEGEATMNVVPWPLQEDGTYECRPGVYYIPRGTVMHWGEKTFLVCGGACSVDKKMRQPFISWWPQEQINDDDIAKCAEAGQVDILLTHDFPIECTIVDHHLDPFWGEEAMANTLRGRTDVSKILAACGAKNVFHGHLHISYVEKIIVNGQEVGVMGLDRDTTPLYDSTHLLNV